MSADSGGEKIADTARYNFADLHEVVVFAGFRSQIVRLVHK